MSAKLMIAAIDRLLDQYPVIQECPCDASGTQACGVCAPFGTSPIEEPSPGSSVQEGELDTPPPHVHQWRIAEPEGAESLGICWTCREWRMFKNWDEANDFVTNTEAKIGC